MAMTKPEDELTPLALEVYEFLISCGPVQRVRIKTELGLTSSQVDRSLQQLSMKNLIEREENNRGWMRKRNIFACYWLSRPWRLTA